MKTRPYQKKYLVYDSQGNEVYTHKGYLVPSGRPVYFTKEDPAFPEEWKTRVSYLIVARSHNDAEGYAKKYWGDRASVAYTEV